MLVVEWSFREGLWRVTRDRDAVDLLETVLCDATWIVLGSTWSRYVSADVEACTYIVMSSGLENSSLESSWVNR